jgi:hypothetical protein
VKINCTIALYYFSSLISNGFYLLLIRIYCLEPNHCTDDTQREMYSSGALTLHNKKCVQNSHMELHRYPLNKFRKRNIHTYRNMCYCVTLIHPVQTIHKNARISKKKTATFHYRLEHRTFTVWKVEILTRKMYSVFS